MKFETAHVCDVFDRRAIPADAVETRWSASDGQRIRRIDWLIPRGAPRGSLLFMPGRGDFYEKYLETLDYWHCHGWRVTAFDWRGQAGSGRLGMDAQTGHVDDFAIWIDDLAELWRQWRATTPAPHVMVCHSMGGHLALRALAERKVDPAALVLTAPMLGLLPGMGFVPAGVLRWIAGAMTALGDPRRPAWNGVERPDGLPEERMARLTHDETRYADEIWWREHRAELAMGAPSWGWISAALASCQDLRRPGALEAIDSPVLMLGTTADRLVDFSAIKVAAGRIARARLVTFGAEARHELLREVDSVRGRVLEAIDDFLDRCAPIQD